MAHHSSSTSKQASGFFIINTTKAKPDAETRKFIRSHVMRGKNTRKARLAKQLAQGSGATTAEVETRQSNQTYQEEEIRVEKEERNPDPPQ